MDIKNTRFSSIEQITGQYLNNRNVRQTDKENVSSFDTILKQKFDDAKTEGLKFPNMQCKDLRTEILICQMNSLTDLTKVLNSVLRRVSGNH